MRYTFDGEKLIEKKKVVWYYQTWFIVASLIFFFPLGIYLMIAKRKTTAVSENPKITSLSPKEQKKSKKKSSKEISLEDARSIWSRWSYSHTQNEQRKRIERVLNGDFNRPMLYPKEAKAYYTGQKGDMYTTTLSECTCPDFQRRNSPCKHMYYLAYKMGVFDLLEDDDYKVTLVRTLYFLPDETLEHLSTMILKNSGKNEQYFLLPKDDETELLLLKGYCIASMANEAILDTFPVAKIKEMFKYVRFPEKPSNNSQKKTFLKWFNQNPKEIASLIEQDFLILELGDDTYKARTKILEKISHIRGKSFDHLDVFK